MILSQVRGLAALIRGGRHPQSNPHLVVPGWRIGPIVRRGDLAAASGLHGLVGTLFRYSPVVATIGIERPRNRVGTPQGPRRHPHCGEPGTARVEVAVAALWRTRAARMRATTRGITSSSVAAPAWLLSSARGYPGLQRHHHQARVCQFHRDHPVRTLSAYRPAMNGVRGAGQVGDRSGWHGDVDQPGSWAERGQEHGRTRPLRRGGAGVAARAHLPALAAVLNHALDRAGIRLSDVDAVAATAGPGRAAALQVGLAASKAYALALDLPHGLRAGRSLRRAAWRSTPPGSSTSGSSPA